MKLEQCLSETRLLQRVGAENAEITALCTDSRAAAPGMLFFALPAVAEGRRDGKYFAAAAERAGAIPVLDSLPEEAPARYLLVPDVRRAFSEIARTFYGHPERELRIVGVTGTKGKTSVTHLLKGVLEKCTGEPVGLIGTNHILAGEREFPSHATTPEAHELMACLRAMAEAGCRTVVMEVSSHSLALLRVEGVPFAAAACLNVGHDHLDYHKTRENYALAKSRIFANAASAAINVDADFAEVMLRAAKDLPCLTFSTEREDAALRARSIRLLRDRSLFEAVFRGRSIPVELPIPGMFSVYNALAVLALAIELGIPAERAAASLSDAEGVRGRCETVPHDGDFTVLVDYAHTPDSLANILHTARGFTKGRLRVLFGCGGDRDRTKRPLMGRIASELADICYLTTDNPRSEEPEAILREILPGMTGGAERRVICDRREAIRTAIHDALPGDCVVLAGKGHEEYQEIKGVKTHFDDREEALRALAERKRG